MVISSKLLNPGERIVISTRQHVKALIVPVLVLLVVLALGVFVEVTVDHGFVVGAVWSIGALAVLWWTVRPALVLLHDLHRGERPDRA